MLAVLSLWFDTTLSSSRHHHIYTKESRVKDHVVPVFERHIWVCVAFQEMISKWVIQVMWVITGNRFKISRASRSNTTYAHLTLRKLLRVRLEKEREWLFHDDWDLNTMFGFRIEFPWHFRENNRMKTWALWGGFIMICSIRFSPLGVTVIFEWVFASGIFEIKMRKWGWL